MRHAPSELEAVLHIFNHDDELKTKALPHVNVEKQTVDWRSILKNHFGSGHYAAVLWAYCIWRNKPFDQDVNPFEGSFSMDAGLRRAVLRALAIHWCIPMDHLRTLKLV